MSYRERLFKITKEEYNKFKNLTKKELENLYGEYSSIYYDILNEKTLHEFGNGVVQDIKENENTKFFINDELHKYYNNGMTLLKLNKNILKNIIINYIKNIKNWLKELEEYSKKLDNIKSSDFEDSKRIIQDYISREQVEWDKIMKIEYNDKDIFIDSWLIKYDIFNLIYIYKTFDFENNVLCIYGS